jgi:hypothetical protein
MSGGRVSLSRAELFAAIRRDKRLDPEMSQRAPAEKYGVHRRTVRQALTSAVPPPRKKPVPRTSVLDPAKGWIDAMLREDLTAPRKQKHTARRIWQRLAQEYSFDQASYSTVCDYVLVRRPEIEAEAREGHRHMNGMVPQVHLPGEEAEVDFADVWVRLAGEAVKCHLFTLRLSYSGKAVHRVFLCTNQRRRVTGLSAGGLVTRESARAHIFALSSALLGDRTPWAEYDRRAGESLVHGPSTTARGQQPDEIDHRDRPPDPADDGASSRRQRRGEGAQPDGAQHYPGAAPQCQ